MTYTLTEKQVTTFSENCISDKFVFALMVQIDE